MYFSGIDLGGTTIKGAIINEKGEILVKKSIPTGADRPQREVVLDMAGLVVELAGELGIELKEISSVGVGTPGAVDPEKGILHFAGNFADFHEVPMAEIMGEKLPGIPIHIENDANVAALGEALFGAGKGSGNAVMITLGTGLGGGVIIDGKIFSGFWHGGTEMGHQVIVPNGWDCTCGRKGCWEAYSSATGLIRMGHEYGIEDEDLDAKKVFDLGDAGDERALKALKDWYFYLALGLINTLNVFQPEYLIIGGGPSARGEKLTEALMPMIKKEIFGGTLKTTVTTAALANDAGVIGAAMLGR